MKQLKSLTSRWKVLMGDILKSDFEIMLSDLKEMKYLGFEGYQDIEKLSETWQIGEIKNLAGNPSVLIKKEDGLYQFMTTIPPGGEFEEHWHSMPEWCKVLKGALKDNLQKSNIWKKGQVAFFPEKQRHKPANASNDKECILEVTFKAKK